MLAHKQGYSQEALIYKPDKRIWTHLDIGKEKSKVELLPKNALIVNLLGALYLVGNNSTLVFEYKTQTFQERNQLVQDKNITHMSFVYIN